MGLRFLPLNLSLIREKWDYGTTTRFFGGKPPKNSSPKCSPSVVPRFLGLRRFWPLEIRLTTPLHPLA